MNKLTILTPTYNRAAYLKKLYRSLVQQTEQNFEWLVVDDGSTDETQELLLGLAEENKVRMRCLRQENGGKHRALNYGIAQIDTELTFIVDSDDFLPENAVQTILSYHEKYGKSYLQSVEMADTKSCAEERGEKGTEAHKNDTNVRLCGYSFLRCHADGKVNTAYFPENELIGTYRDVRINGGIDGDKAEVFYTKILRQFPFPEFEGEKFLPEDLVWMQMSGPYQMVHINENIYICDYLESGLTRTGRRMKIYSPRGMMLRSRVYLEDSGVRLKIRLKMMMLYLIYGRIAGERIRNLGREVHPGWLFGLCILPAEILRRKWKKEG